MKYEERAHNFVTTCKKLFSKFIKMVTNFSSSLKFCFWSDNLKSTVTITGLGYNYNYKYDYNYNYRPGKIAITGRAITHTNQEKGDLGGQ